MTATLDQPVKAPTFQRLSLRRKVADNVATVLVTLSVLVALVPLLWVLYTVIVKGIGAVMSPTWWFNSQAGMTAFQAGGGAYHAIIGTLLQGLVCAIISIPIGVFVGIYLVEYGGGTKLGKTHHLHGGHPHRGALDRGRTLHLRAVGRDAGLPAVRALRCRLRWCC